MVRLHTKNQLHSLPGNASKVCVVVGWLRANLVIALPSLGQAEQQSVIAPLGIRHPELFENHVCVTKYINKTDLAE